MKKSINKPIFFALLAIAVAFFPIVVASSYWLNLVNLAISFSIACLGLNIVLGYTGQLSLAQAAFWGVGAYTSALLTTRLGLPVWPAMLLAFVVAGCFGILLGVPTLKLSGHYLAMTTIGFGIILQLVLINQISLTGGSDGIMKIPAPSIGSFELDDPDTYFYVAAVSLIFFTWVSIRLKASRYGRAFLAIRGNEMAAETMGIDTTMYKVTAFALSAAFAGYGGAIFAHGMSHYISPDTFSFDQSVILLAMTVLGGDGSAIGAIVGAVLLSLIPEILRFLKDYYMMVYGAGIVSVMIFMPGGIAALANSLRLVKQVKVAWQGEAAPAVPEAGSSETETVKAEKAFPTAKRETPEGTLLEIKNLSKHFGGLKAVDCVDMQVRYGQIQALIGPNGSGKTTILNMLSGLYIPTGGAITLEGNDITGRRPHVITAHGIARTFQNIRLFGELSVLDNVLIGQHTHMKAGLAGSVFQPASQRAEEKKIREKAMAMLDFVGLRDKALAQANSLPYGRQRLLELARALVAEPKLLLLDEPAAGLNPKETEVLVDHLYQIRNHGITILLVEHDMSLVMNVSDHITVLNFGRKIAEGKAEAIEKNQEVIDAYLGTEIGNA